jgi:conjugative relaxase-like TrwC/TraI family protein
MLSIKSGHDVGYLTGPVAGGRESYYSGAVAAGEPPGRWYGSGAVGLGLVGEVDNDVLEAVYSHLIDPRDPAVGSRSTWGEADTLGASHRRYRSADDLYKVMLADRPTASPEERSEMRSVAERNARQAIAFEDVTFSPSKSVSVLGVALERAANDARAAGDEASAERWSALHRSVEDAVMAGARASIDYLEQNGAVGRVGRHGGGEGRWIDSDGFVVAQFLQHDSRDHDPQLHVHQAILNKQFCVDGKWHGLDGVTLTMLKGAAGAVAERVMEAHLARELGVRFIDRKDGHGREVAGIGQALLDLFSSRRRALTGKAAGLTDAFRERFGREPSLIEQRRLAQQATLSTRVAKTHDGETREQFLDRCEAQTRSEVGTGLAEVAQQVMDLQREAAPVERFSEEEVVQRALDQVLGKERQSWTRADLVRAVSDSLPANLGVDPEKVQPILEALTNTALERAVRLSPEVDEADLPAHFTRRNGESQFSRPGATRYTTEGTRADEQFNRAAAVTRGAPAMSVAEANAVIARYAESGRELGVDQAAALRGVLTSGAQLEVLLAPAGSGKTFLMGALAEAHPHGRVIGLAPTQVAANQLAEEGLAAWNTTAWLQRDAELGAGDVVVLDEASMATTAQVREIEHRCAQVGAKLLVVGDPRQLAQVGPGGALSDLAERATRYELTEVRRQEQEWERRASLRLRDGDVSALAEYDKHGRLVAGGTAEQAEQAAGREWLADTLAGKESLLLVGSNEQAAGSPQRVGPDRVGRQHPGPVEPGHLPGYRGP